MKKRNNLKARRLITTMCLLLLSTLTACSSTMKLPGGRLARATKVYFIPLDNKPYMIYISAQEPKERSRSFSLADSVAASSTLLYPATIYTINKQAFDTYKKVLGDRLVPLPAEMRKTKHTLLGVKKGYRYRRFKADFYIQLTFKEKNQQPQAAYRIRGLDFLKEALPVYPEGSQLILNIYMRNLENRKFVKVYQQELNLFLKAPDKKDSIEPFNEAFVWHSAYASGEKQLRFDFQKHVTILRASVLKRVSSFFIRCGDELEKAMK